MKGGLYKPGERIDDTKRLRFDGKLCVYIKIICFFVTIVPLSHQRLIHMLQFILSVSALNTPPSMRGIGRGANRGMTRGFFGQGFRGRGRGFGRGRGRGTWNVFCPAASTCTVFFDGFRCKSG